MVLAGVLLKLGGYGFIRLAIRLFRISAVKFSRLFLLIGILGVIYPSLPPIRQVDMKRIVAYASIGHMSMSIGSLFPLSPYGPVGSYLL